MMPSDRPPVNAGSVGLPRLSLLTRITPNRALWDQKTKWRARYWRASVACAAATCSAPARSAMVPAAFRIRWCSRAERSNGWTAKLIDPSPVTPNAARSWIPCGPKSALGTSGLPAKRATGPARADRGRGASRVDASLPLPHQVVGRRTVGPIRPAYRRGPAQDRADGLMADAEPGRQRAQAPGSGEGADFGLLVGRELLNPQRVAQPGPAPVSLSRSEVQDGDPAGREQL